MADLRKAEIRNFRTLALLIISIGPSQSRLPNVLKKLIKGFTNNNLSCFQRSKERLTPWYLGDLGVFQNLIVT